LFLELLIGVYSKNYHLFLSSYTYFRYEGKTGEEALEERNLVILGDIPMNNHINAELSTGRLH